MRGSFSLIMVAASILAVLPAWGHGTAGYSERADGVRVVAQYDGGESMSYAAVEINAPGRDIPFQIGRTDRNGVFMFVPDQPGRWRIAISDALGHRLVVEREIEQQTSAAGQAASSRQVVTTAVSRREGIVAGVAVIFGLCGLFYGWQARRRLSPAEAERQA